MSDVTCDLAISLDGFVAGPHQSLEHPLGVGGGAVHEWHMGEMLPEDQAVVDLWLGATTGAHVMGRHMFGPGRGAWDLDWTGWWGPEPPYAVPVFVLTHHEREPLVMGATTFTFVTDGIESALARAREAAGERNVAIAGGAATANAYLAAGLVDVLTVHVAPVLLGRGERLFDGVPPLDLTLTHTSGSPRVSHLSYRIGRSA